MILFLKILQYTWDSFRIIKKSSNGPTGFFRILQRILYDPTESWEDPRQDPKTFLQDPTGSYGRILQDPVVGSCQDLIRILAGFSTRVVLWPFLSNLPSLVSVSSAYRKGSMELQNKVI